MTYYGAKEIVAAFRLVRGNTITIAEEIPEDKYDFKPSPDVRTVGRTLVHIAAMPSLQLNLQKNRVTDLKTVNFRELIGAILAEEEKPRSKADILTYLKTEADRFAGFVDGLSEQTLAEIVTMVPGATPGTKSRLEMLLTVKEHEMHHRGQLMVVQRMLGLVPHLTRQMLARMAQPAAT